MSGNLKGVQEVGVFIHHQEGTEMAGEYSLSAQV